MNRLIFASNNQGKIKEIQHHLTRFNIEIVPQSDFAVPDIEETGLSFVENALLKARHAAKLTGLPAMADDSGLSVDALHGAPGIYSARYAGEQASSSDNMTKLLAALADVPEAKRTASFHCVLVLLRSADDPIPIICHGQWSGRILKEAQGSQGFGYDPVFYLPEQACSAAQLSLDLKNQLSHRGKALQELIAHLAIETFIQENDQYR